MTLNPEYVFRLYPNAGNNGIDFIRAIAWAEKQGHPIYSPLGYEVLPLCELSEGHFLSGGPYLPSRDPDFQMEFKLTFSHFIAEEFIIPDDPLFIMFEKTREGRAFLNNPLIDPSPNIRERRMIRDFGAWCREHDVDVSPNRFELRLAETDYPGLKPMGVTFPTTEIEAEFRSVWGDYLIPPGWEAS